MIFSRLSLSNNHAWPFSHWFALFVALAVFITGLSISIISQNTLSTHNEGVFKHDVEQNLQRLSLVIAPSVLDKDRVSLALALDDWQTDARIPNIRVYDIHHELIAQAGTANDKLPSISQRIIHDQTWVGIVEASVDKHSVDQVYWAHLSINVLISALLSILLGALAWLLGKKYQDTLEVLNKALNEDKSIAYSHSWCEQLNTLQKSHQKDYETGIQKAQVRNQQALLQPLNVAPSTTEDAVTMVVFTWNDEDMLPSLFEHLSTVSKLYSASPVLCDTHCAGLLFEHSERLEACQNALYAGCLTQALTNYNVSALVLSEQASITPIEHPWGKFQIAPTLLEQITPALNAIKEQEAHNACWVNDNIKTAYEENHNESQWQEIDESTWQLVALDKSDTLLIERQTLQLKHLDTTTPE